MQCPRCQHGNPDDVKFCGECGARLDATCRACRAANPPTNKFCHQCGASLSGGLSPAPSPSPESYTRRSEAHAICLAGDVGSTGGAEDAPGYYREALAIAGQLGMRPLGAHCHLGLGNLYRRTGKGEQAREYLTTTTTMYREMGMRFWREQADAELRRP